MSTAVMLLYGYREFALSNERNLISRDVASNPEQASTRNTVPNNVSVNDPVQTKQLAPTVTPIPDLKQKSILVTEDKDSELKDVESKVENPSTIKSNEGSKKPDHNEGLISRDPDFYSNISVEIQGDALPPLGDRGDSAIGTKAPIIRGISLEGDEIYIGGEGYYSLIIVLAHWCPHCRNEVRELTKFLKDVEVPSNLKLISLATSIRSDRPNYPPHEWFEQEKWPLPVVVDTSQSEIAIHYGVTSYPFFILIDDKGNIQSRRPGRLGIEGFENLFSNLEKVRSDN